MTSNPYFAGGTEAGTVDDLLNRLRLTQERLARLLEPAAGDRTQASSAAPKVTRSSEAAPPASTASPDRMRHRRKVSP
jgi:hypothetical protein